MRKLPELPEKGRTIFKIEVEPEIPTFADVKKQDVDIRYSLLAPYAYAHIFWDEKAKEIVYYLEEPELTASERKILNLLEDGIKELVNMSYLQLKKGETIIEYLEKNLKVMLTELRITLTKDSYLKIMYYIYRDFVGLGKIEPLMNDYFIEDIECNGTEYPIYIVHRKFRNLKTNIIFKKTKDLATFVEKLAQKSGQYISYATPLLDAALPDGSVDYEEPVIFKENNTIKISKIGEFVDKFYKKDKSNTPIKVEKIEIPCFDQKTLKINWKPVDYVYRHKINENLYELILEYGKKIKLTGAHSIFSLIKEGVKPTKTEDLKEGDYVAYPLKIPQINNIKEINMAEKLSKTQHSNKLILNNIPAKIFEEKEEEVMDFLKENYKMPRHTFIEHRRKKILPLKLYKILKEETLRKCSIKTTSAVGIPTFLKVDKNLMKVLGLYIAEGWTSRIKNHYRLYFCLGAHELELIKELKDALKETFNISAYIEPEKSNAVKIVVNSFILWILLTEVLKLSKGAKNKRIPEIVLNANIGLQQEFLKYWSLGDYGSTSSKMLQNDISYLSIFNSDIVAFYDRQRESIIDNRAVKSHEFYTNFFVRSVSNDHSHMIPMEMFNPLKNTHHRFINKKLSRDRLKRILNEERYNKFRDLKNTKDRKFLNEWTKRGFIQGNILTDKGDELLSEIDTINKIIDSDLGFAKVKKINRKKSTSEFVYDLSVKGHENFISGTGGICCHNSRINATFTEDISSRGPTFTIRKFTKKPWTPTQLMYLRTVSPEMLAYLWLLIEYEKNIMVIGGTGSGKTSLLNGLSFFIPPQARVVSIEDTRELNIEHLNWLPSVARSGVGLANLVGQKYGEITLFNLLKESFRMNPDYVIIGEIRGEEAYVLFQGMASIKGDETLLLLNHDKPKNIAIKDLKPNIIYKAISLDKEGNMKIMPVKKRLVHPARNELYEITTKTGRKVTITPNHSILTEENNKIKSDYAEDLKKGGKILIPAKIPCNYANESHLNLLEELPDARVFAPKYIKEAVKKLGYDKASNICKIKSISDYYSNFSKSKPSSLNIESFKELMKQAKINYKIEDLRIKYDNNSKSLPAKLEISDELLRLLGYYASEGTLQNKKKNSKLALYAKREKILEDMRQCITKIIKEDPRQRKCERGYGSSEELSFSNKPLISLIENLCKKGSLNKTIPDFIFGLSKERIGQFLSALYSGDGTFTKNYYGYFTISKSLTDKLAKLLLVYGIVPIIRERKRRKNKDYEVIFYRHDQKKEFLKYMNPIRENLPIGNPSNKKQNIINDFYIDKIKDIKKIKLEKPEPVYDISIQGSRNFIGGFGGVMLHNSGHPSFGTMHANDIDTMIKRLETPPINLSPSLVETMDAVCVMVHSKVAGKAVRRVKEVTEIISVTGSKATTNNVFQWNPTSDTFAFSGRSFIFNELTSQEGIPQEELTREFRRRTALLIQLYNQGIFDFSTVQKIINTYSKVPEKVLAEYGVQL